MPHVRRASKQNLNNFQFEEFSPSPLTSSSMYNACMRCVDVQRQKNENLLNAWLTAKRVLLPKPFPCQWTVSRVVIQRNHILRLHPTAYALRIELHNANRTYKTKPETQRYAHFSFALVNRMKCTS